MNDDSDNSHGNPFRAHPEQYQFADRNFRNGDWVIFVGPPDDEFQPGMISDPGQHALYHRRGQVRVGPSEDIRVFPDDKASNMYWVKVDGDKHPLRQVVASWLVKEPDFVP